MFFELLEYVYVVYLKKINVMVLDLNENVIVDFDIDDVIDWDKYDIFLKVCWVYFLVNFL